jgi:glycosyltransferase involved in cell wall biosynthesis
MKIVIATPLYPPEIGGPATYAKLLEEGLPEKGIEVEIVKFSDVRRYPKFLRHGAFFWRVWRAARSVDAVLAFDTWSTGVPTLFAAALRGKKTLVRIGGDFLWETYVGRTHTLIKLSEFYAAKKSLSLKELCIFFGTRWVIRRADVLVFNTSWQKDMWGNVYGFDWRKASVIENEYPAERSISPAKARVFVAAGRQHPLKNGGAFKEVFSNLKKSFPDIELDERVLSPSEHGVRIRDSYAVVIPSVSEVSPNTAIDAIRYGKPFIMPNDSGARERLADAGIFVDTLDMNALRHAMEVLLDTEEYERACMRVRGFAFTHSWEDVVKEFSHILNILCVS